MPERPHSSARTHTTPTHTFGTKGTTGPQRTRQTRMWHLATLLTVAGITLIFITLCIDISLVNPHHLAAALAAPVTRTTYPSSYLLDFQSSNPSAMSNNRRSAAASSSRQQKAPSKKEVGNAGWTLIHSIAANFPENPSDKEKHYARAFLRSMTKLYPCKRCRQHFSKFLASTPPDLSNRESFMLWACGAHNAVNQRQGKRVFPCDMKQLEARWGDCGCSAKK